MLDSYLYPTLGGVLIGISASLLLYLNGRISGISGIYWSSFFASDSRLWRVLFVIGLPLGAIIAHWLFGISPPVANSSLLTACIAGLFVGVGVKLGSGCTSGHGVCGIGRLSVRSALATLVFMCAGIVTVFVMREVIL